MGETDCEGNWVCLVLMARAIISKSLIQFLVDGWDCVPSLLFGLRPNCRPTPLMETPGHSKASLTQSLVGTMLLFPGPDAYRFCLCPYKARIILPGIDDWWNSAQPEMGTKYGRLYSFCAEAQNLVI